MKICRIVYEMPPPWDGLAPHPFEITSSQAKKGHELTVFCGRWPKSGKPETIKNVELIHINREPLGGLINVTSSVALFFRYLKWRKKNTPDIIHSHGHFAIWIYYYRNFLIKFFPWAKELKIPLVAHFHNTAKGRWESFIKDKKDIKPISKMFAWPLAVFSDKLAVKSASACIFVSQGNLDEAIKFYNADPRRSFVVESGVNNSIFTKISQPEREKSRKETGFDIYDKVVVNVGNMVERKNIHLLVEAMSQLPAVYKLLLVGSGDPTYRQKIMEIESKFGVEDRIVRIDYTPYPLIPIAYQMADVFVLPSSWEGLPKVVLESLSTGVPAIVSGFKLKEEITGLFYLDNTEPKSIAQKIKEVVESQPNVDTQKIYSKYSWDEKIGEIERVYEFAKQNNVL